MSHIEIHGVGKVFPRTGGQFLRVLEDIDLEIEDEICVLLGPSGCGKSTLLRQIAGLDSPSEGAILLDDNEICGPSRNVGMVFQKYTSFPWLTVTDNVAYGLKITGTSRIKRHQMATKWISDVGLQGFEDSYPESLSGGMQQRVAIARTLAIQPKVVLMDEPFGALDAQVRGEMQDLVLKIRSDSRATIVFVTHDVEEALYLGDRVVLLTSRPGRIAATWELRDREFIGLERTSALRHSTRFMELERQILLRLRHPDPL